MPAAFELSVLGDSFVVCRLDPSAALPAWTLEGAGFVALTRTDDELSVICAEDRVPTESAGTLRWRGLKVHGPFPFETVGVLSTLSQALADARISLLAVSTHDTEYLFVRAADFAHAVRVLRHGGHTVHTPT
jgi:uncharacterized protein